MQKAMAVSEKRWLMRNGARHTLAVIVLLVGFAFNFAHRDGWKDSQWPGDEPAYIDTAYDYWHHGTSPGAITWSPGYIQLMSPFVGVLGKEAGYKVWRFVLFAAVSLLVYAVFMRIIGSIWSGTILALFSQLMLMPYLAPSLQMLACLIYLLCIRLLASGSKYTGLVFVLLLNGIYVSGTLSFVLFVFGVSCLLFHRESIFTRQFLIQFTLGLALFIAVLGHFSYDIRNYSEEAASRGRAGLYHQLSLYIVKSGRSMPYLTLEEADPARDVQSDYERHLKAVDRYYLAKFGETENDLISYRHDPQWPLFVLDWPWLAEQEPELMRDYALDVLKTLRDSLLGSFQTVNPFSAYRLDGYRVTDMASFMRRAVFNIVSVSLLVFLLILPYLSRWPRKNIARLPGLPSRIQTLFLLSTLAAFVPLMLVKPLPIYFPPFIPAYLVGVALFGRLLFSGLQWIRPV